MKLNPQSNDEKLRSVSADAGKKRRLDRKVKMVQDLVSQMPIVIEYGCHTIELEPSEYHHTGFTFEGREPENGGQGLVLHIL